MKKWNSAFARLAYSYISIVLVIVLLLCSIFYTYFSSSYKEELKNKNRLILDNTARTIETSVLQRVQKIYLELSVDKTADLRLFFGSSHQMNASKLLGLQELLKSKVANNSDIIQAIHAYDPGRHAMLSSLYGLLFQADQGDSAVFFADWMSGIHSNMQGLWTPTRWIPDDIFTSLPGGSGTNLITYAHNYPYQPSGEKSDLIIAIDVKESAIHGIIRNMMPSQYEHTFIWDRVKNRIAGSDEKIVNMQEKEEDTSIAQVFTSAAESGSFSDTIHKTSHVISYQTLPSTGWKIYSVVPASSFYEQSLIVNKLILGICMLAVLIGIALSGIMAKASYSPLKRLVGTIQTLSGHPVDQEMNEYRLIDTAFIQLNDKVTSLEETLQANSPIIKRNVILSILRNPFTDAELPEELASLGISREFSHYSCLLLNSGEAFAPLSSGNMQVAINRMIHQLEAASRPKNRIIAEELPDKKIVVILCTDEAPDAILDQLSQLVLSEGKRQFQLDFQLSHGSWVKRIADIHLSYNEAETLMKYAYFLPEISVLKERSLLEREDSIDEIPQAILLRFKEKLYARQSHEIAMAVEQLIATMREGRYPADYCHFILANTVFVLSDYLKSIRYKHPTQGHPDLYKQYIDIPNILYFRDWLLDSVSTFIATTEKRNSERALSTLDSTKQYIENHLSEDLSLEMVASKVFISAKYLSKLFKEELGVTYTDYITSRRMERAKALIEKQNMTVEQIASSVGYGTAAYFIKKFKEMYGCTPGNYLRNMAKQA